MGAAFVSLSLIAKNKKANYVYEDEPEEKNPLEGKKVVFIEDKNDAANADGVKGHLEVVGERKYNPGFYDKYIKRGLDIFLSFGGLVVLSPIMGAIALAIKMEDPGPVLFTQKRIGQNKKYFKLHKFRSMRLDTPHDVPTHQLERPDQYITKVGKFIRAHSLDELPQIWDIFIGNMSVIGPRPALWNQDVLTAERDKYGANDVKPGLTGWAQINGRDELEIADKARLDGEYVEKLGLIMDIKCFLGSLHVFRNDESVVEGGTGKIHKMASRHYTDGKSDAELIGKIGFGETVSVDRDAHKKVLITGAGSYIGESFKAYAEKNYSGNFSVDSVDMIDGSWRERDFSAYDIVYHVAGIAHADVGNVSDETKEKYYAVNTDLAVEVCQKAKAEGVKEFLFMSSMIVYGESAPFGVKKIVDEQTVPNPANFYGDSKLQADVGVRELADDNFKVIVLRPPMIYGKGSKGNYPTLAKFAKKLPIFPKVENERSMLYIENLCEFLCQTMLIDVEENAVVLIPQNGEWTKTSEMVEEIAEVSGKKIWEIGVLNPAVSVASRIPGKIGGLVNKAFGNMAYAHEMSEYLGMDYQVVGLRESIMRTEGNVTGKPKALILASVASMIEQFNMHNIQILLDNGYDIDVACNFYVGNNCSDEEIRVLLEALQAMGVNAFQVNFSRNALDIKSDMKALEQVESIACGKAVSLNDARSVDEQPYTLLHSHSPIGGIVGRIVAKKYGIRSIYTAHGFHFYKGGSRKNWMLFYPIERIFSAITDTLITINIEDYKLAKKKFHAKEVYHIPGIGVDIGRFYLSNFDYKAYREKLGLLPSDYMILSVGELNDNKNQILVIKSIAAMNDPSVHYFMAGVGKNWDMYEAEAKKAGIAEQVHLLGFRTDIAELNYCADVFAFPSIREGLGMAALEALACGTPVCGMNTRGISEYVVNGETGYLFDNTVVSCKNAIEKVRGKKPEMRDACLKMVQKYSSEETDKVMKKIYGVEV